MGEVDSKPRRRECLRQHNPDRKAVDESRRRTVALPFRYARTNSALLSRIVVGQLCGCGCGSGRVTVGGVDGKILSTIAKPCCPRSFVSTNRAMLFAAIRTGPPGSILATHELVRRPSDTNAGFQNRTSPPSSGSLASHARQRGWPALHRDRRTPGVTRARAAAHRCASRCRTTTRQER